MHVKGIMTGVRPAWNGSFERGKALSFSSGLSGGKRKKFLKTITDMINNPIIALHSLRYLCSLLPVIPANTLTT